MNDHSRARKDLARAQEIFGQGESYDQLLIYKWLSVIESLETDSVRPLIKLRQLASERQHWETVREADLFALKLRFDQKKFDHLFFGTPMAGYRARLEEQIPHAPSGSFSLGAARPDSFLDLETGLLHGTQGELNSGKKIHYMLSALLKDFYVPRNMGSLFAELYPDEYFNINSSPLKIRQILHRTRLWLEEIDIPVTIEFANRRYRLTIDGPFAFKMPLQRDSLDGNLPRWEELKRCFAHSRTFTAREARDRLGLSRASVHRLAQWAITKGYLRKVGNGTATFYEISGTSPRRELLSG